MSGNSAGKPRSIGDSLLACNGLCIAVCDQSSPFNRPTIADDAWASTRPDSPDKLWEFNSYLANYTRGEQALVWLLVLMGVFRLKVELHDLPEQMPPTGPSDASIGFPNAEQHLQLPTGRLGWIDVENAAETGWREIAVVPPGRYLCRMTGDENPVHWDVADPADYPPGDEDWTLHLARVGNVDLVTRG